MFAVLLPVQTMVINSSQFVSSSVCPPDHVAVGLKINYIFMKGLG